MFWALRRRGDEHVEVQSGSGNVGHGLAHERAGSVLQWEGFMDSMEGKNISLNYFLISVFHM